jgi:hypothetical protein
MSPSSNRQSRIPVVGNVPLHRSKLLLSDQLAFCDEA